MSFFQGGVPDLSQLTEDAPQPKEAGPSHYREMPEFHTLDDLFDLEPPEPLIEGLLSQGSVHMLTGSPGSYKSFLGLGWALSIASPERLRTWEGYPVRKHGLVLYVIAEGREGFWERVAAWGSYHNVTRDELFSNFVPYLFDPQLGDPYESEWLINRIAQMRPELVIFDTKARVTVTADENSNTEQASIIRVCDRIKEETKASILIIHHTNSAGTGPRGASAWPGAVDADMRLQKDGRLITLTCEKRKDMVCDHPHHFEAKDQAIYPDMRRTAQFFDVSSSVVIVSSDPEEATQAGGSVDRGMLKMFDDNDLGSGMTMSDIATCMDQRARVNKDQVLGSMKRLLRGGYISSNEAASPKYHKLRDLQE